MRAISFDQHGTPDVLRLIEIDIPTPGVNDVLLRNHAIGVNYVDVQHRQGGIYEVTLPLIPGIEAAGIVEAVGAGVTEFAPGDRVAYGGYMGGNYAEYTRVDANRLVPVPDAVDFDTAAATLLQGMTTYSLTQHVYPVQAGDWVLIHAAAGGVGSLLVQCALLRGANVIATVSSDAKAQFVRALGAQHVINYTTQNVEQSVLQLTDGMGVHVVYDAVGRDTFEMSLAALRKRGYMVIYGQSSGGVPPFDVNRLSGITPNSSRGSLFLTWASLGHYVEARADLLEHARAVFDLLAQGHLKPSIAGRLPLENAAEAHRLLEARKVMGKLLLIP
jgi:NADPH:quinone reductase